MLSSHKGLQPFSSAQAAWIILQRAQRPASLAWCEEMCAEDRTGDALVAALEQKQLRARLTIVSAADLRFVTTPSLVKLEDESWIVLQRVRAATCEVRDSIGVHRTMAAQLSKGSLFTVIDVSWPPSQAEGLWASSIEMLRHLNPLILQVALATLAIFSTSLVLPILTGIMVDQALPNDATSMVDIIGGLILATTLLRVWMSWLRERIILALATKVEAAAETDFLNHVLRLPFAVLQKKRFADLLQGFLALTVARETFSERAVGNLLDSGLAVGFLFAMFVVLPKPTAFIALVLSAMIVVVVFLGRVQAREQRKETSHQIDEQGYLSEMIAGIETIKANGAEDVVFQRWSHLFGRTLRSGLAKSRIGLSSDAWSGLLSQGIHIGILIGVGLLVLAGSVKVGTLLEYIQFTAGLLAALSNLTSIQLASAMLRPQLEHTSNLMREHANPPRFVPHRARGTLPSSARVVMKDVWFRYAEDEPWILQGFNLTVEPGQHLVLSGVSGSGKSTVLRLLAGLQTPTKGQTIMSTPDEASMAFRARYLPQTVRLFGGSVLDNLVILSGGASEENLVYAATLTGLDELLRTLPMGLKTILVPGGGTLSGGQRQLIALTAIVASRSSLILLDEALSNLDSISSVRIRGVLQSLKTTVLESSHRVSTTDAQTISQPGAGITITAAS